MKPSKLYDLLSTQLDQLSPYHQGECTLHSAWNLGQVFAVLRTAQGMIDTYGFSRVVDMIQISQQVSEDAAQILFTKTSKLELAFRDLCRPLKHGFEVIAAVDMDYGIGKDQGLPWKVPADMKHFRDNTMHGTVIMGRKTWESIPTRHRPLPRRLNIVVTRQDTYTVPPGVVVASSLQDALDKAYTKKMGRIFVIGGAALYAEALNHENCARVQLTRIPDRFDCDTFFPKFSSRYNLDFVSHTATYKDAKLCRFEQWSRA